MESLKKMLISNGTNSLWQKKKKIGKQTTIVSLLGISTICFSGGTNSTNSFSFTFFVNRYRSQLQCSDLFIYFTNFIFYDTFVFLYLFADSFYIAIQYLKNHIVLFSFSIML